MTSSDLKTGIFARRRAAVALRGPRTAKSLILILTAFLIGAVVWADRTEIQELARAEGEIVPSGRLTFIEHFDGGVIEEIAVSQGDRVVAGQVLARLSSPTLRRDEIELSQELSILEAHRDMLRALVTGDAVDPVPGTYAATRRKLFFSREAMLRDRVQARSEALAIARDSRDVARERESLGAAERARLQKLFDMGYLPQGQISAEDDLLQRIRSDLLNTETALARALSDEADARSAVVEVRLAYLSDLHKELYDVEQDIARVKARQSEIEEQKRRLTMTTPVSGIVQSVATTTPGEVIEPGERLFEILPTTVRLVAEIRVKPEDIGHVAIGNPVTIKPTSFDSRRYGELNGEISSISPTSLLDPEGRPYFGVDVSLDRTTLGQGPFTGEVSAGMVVQAEMQTSKRTVLQYLLKPIDQSLAVAMTER